MQHLNYFPFLGSHERCCHHFESVIGTLYHVIVCVHFICLHLLHRNYLANRKETLQDCSSGEPHQTCHFCVNPKFNMTARANNANWLGKPQSFNVQKLMRGLTFYMVWIITGMFCSKWGIFVLIINLIWSSTKCLHVHMYL